MKRIYALLILAVLALLQGCKVETIEYGGLDGETDEPGYLVFGNFNLQVENYAEEITTEQSSALSNLSTRDTEGLNGTIAAPDDYKVRIRNIKSGEELLFTYADLKLAENQKLPLTPGTYVVSAESADYEEYNAGEYYAEWNMPVYFGSVTSTVIKRTETSVDDLVCMLANIKTTVSLTPDLQNMFMTDAECEEKGLEKLSVTLSIGDNSLVFDRAVSDAGTPGYFKAVSLTNTLKITLKGQYNKAAADDAPEYVTVNWEKEITNCKAGQWRKISVGVANANQGNVQFQITVENWAYDEKVDVDVMDLYTVTEEMIPDEDISDADSPVVTLEGGSIEQEYVISSANYDESLNKWTKNLKILATPAAGSELKTVKIVFESDNPEFMDAFAAAGIGSCTVSLWPLETAASSYVVASMSSGTNVLSAVVNDKGMSALFAYKGLHTAKIIAKDDQYRTSYTTLKIRVLDGDIVVSGPEIVWKNTAGTMTYDFDKRYNHDEVEIVIDVTTQSAFTGFTVDIASDVLTPTILAGVNLSDHLDLINPGEYETSLSNLGFPVGEEITGTNRVSFDITAFMSLITVLNMEGYCDFKLTVTDASGTVEKTIQLNVSLN